MDIGLREWLFAIGIIVIAAVLFDGWRRMSGNKSNLKFRLDRNLTDLPDEENSEILGPARTVKKREPSLTSADDIDLGLHADTKVRGAYKADVAQETFGLDDDNTDLLNPYDEDFEEPPEKAEKDLADYEEILIIHVVAR